MDKIKLLFYIFLIPACTSEADFNKMSLNEKLTYLAWHSFNAGNFSTTINYSIECIVTFREQALTIQSTIKKRPPNGAGLRLFFEKDKILARGPLNDVGTCYFLLGRSYQGLGEFNKAKEAFEACLLFKYARTYDPEIGNFWAPSEQSECYIKKMKTIIEYIDKHKDSNSWYYRNTFESTVETYKNLEIRGCGSPL